MIASEVVHIGAVILDHLQNPIEKAGMLSLPTSGFFELPTVDDVTVEDEIFAAVLFQKSGNLFGFGAFGAQVNVRDDDSFEISLHSMGFDRKLGFRYESIMFRLLCICFEFGIFFG